MLNVPEDVLPYALLYIRIYLLGMPAILAVQIVLLLVLSFRTVLFP